jgi:hypothetical protein
MVQKVKKEVLMKRYYAGFKYGLCGLKTKPTAWDKIRTAVIRIKRAYRRAAYRLGH